MVARDPYMPPPIRQAKKDDRVSEGIENISSYLTRKVKRKCVLCEGEHALYKCEKYLQKTAEERLKFVRAKHLCFNCLGVEHNAQECKSKYRCYVSGCGMPHHTSIHECGLKDIQKMSVACASTKRNNVFMKVVPVKIMSETKTIDTYALLDDGSEATIVRQDLADELKLDGLKQRVVIATITSEGEEIYSKRVSFSVTGNCDEAETFTIEDAYVVPKCNFKVSAQRVPPEFASAGRYNHLQGFHFQDIAEKDIKLLIGADNHRAIMISHVVEGSCKGPIAAKTPLGWTIFGRDDQHTVQTQHLHINKCGIHSASGSARDYVEDHDEIKSFWTTEGFGTMVQLEESMSIEDQLIIKESEESTHLAENGHYKVKMPFKEDSVPEFDNYPVAERRFSQLSNKFKRQPDLYKSYKEVIDGYIHKGYARKLTSEELDAGKAAWILPHHAVLNPNKPKKIRVVFDCAAKYKGKCLNDFLHTGPDLVNNLAGILLRFRNFPVAIVADIEAMYHQVMILSIFAFSGKTT